MPPASTPPVSPALRRDGLSRMTSSRTMPTSPRPARPRARAASPAPLSDARQLHLPFGVPEESDTTARAKRSRKRAVSTALVQQPEPSVDAMDDLESGPDIIAAELPDEGEVDAIVAEAERVITSPPADATSSFAHYLHDLQQYPVLTPAQEIRLARQARLGSVRARTSLVNHNLRFVISIARKHAAHGVNLEDLVQEGNRGLMRAVEKFDETRGVRFVSYAVWWIQQACRAALAKGQRAVPIPITRATQLARVNRAQAELQRRLGRSPTYAEISRTADVAEDMVVTLLTLAQPELSLDAPHPSDPDSGGVLGDRLGSSKSLERAFERAARTEAIAQVLQKLRSRDAEILTLCYGLQGRRELTLEEVGAKYNITRERVRQIRDRALKDLRKAGIADTLLDFHHSDLNDE